MGRADTVTALTAARMSRSGSELRRPVTRLGSSTPDDLRSEAYYAHPL
jgi:hypothetical protein